MKRWTVTACLLLAVVCGVWWSALKRLPESSEREGESPRTSAGREPRVRTADGARMGKRLPPDANDYETRLHDMILLSVLGGRDRMMELFERWAKEDPEVAFKWATSPARADDPFAAKAVEIMVERDFERAKEMLETLPASREKASSLAAIVSEIAKSDPEAALAYFNKNDVGFYVNDTWRIIGESITRTDEKLALKLLSPTSGDGRTMRSSIANYLNEMDLLAGIAEGWGRRDFEGMFRWADKLPNEEKIMAFQAAGPLWVESDPATAMNYLSVLAEEASASSAFALSLQAWGKLDPQAALQWLESSRVANDGFHSSCIYRGWLESDPLQAMAAL
jgi:hypothetical protein